MSELGGETIDNSLIVAARQAYDTLLPQAAHVAGMPYNTPLRWQEVHGETPDDSPVSGVVSRYIMVDLGDGRSLTLYRNFVPRSPYSGEWEITTKVPDPNSPWAQVVATKITQDSRGQLKFDKTLETSYDGRWRGDTEPTGTELDDAQALIEEAAETAPQKQREFMPVLAKVKQAVSLLDDIFRLEKQAGVAPHTNPDRLKNAWWSTDSETTRLQWVKDLANVGRRSTEQVYEIYRELSLDRFKSDMPKLEICTDGGQVVRFWSTRTVGGKDSAGNLTNYSSYPVPVTQELLDEFLTMLEHKKQSIPAAAQAN